MAVLQGTPEWFEQRRGKVTASRIADLMAKTKSGYSTSRQNYLMQLLCERLTGKVEEGYKSTAMQRGNDLEAEARNWYQLETGESVEEVSFIDHPEINFAGASPDGLVGAEGLIEIKCPNTAKKSQSTAITNKCNGKWLSLDENGAILSALTTAYPITSLISVNVFPVMRR